MDRVRRATEADSASVGHILAAGFSSDPVMSWVFDEPGRSSKLETFFGFLAREALVPLGATFILPGSASCWTPPNTAEWPPERSERFGALLEATCSAEDLARLGVLDAATQACHPSEPHWYLGSIATVPERQGLGSGSTLLGVALELVDSEGLPAYLESTNPRNVGLYERFGFDLQEHVLLDRAGPSITTMWRPERRRS